ncbi:MAG: transposase [Pseudomonadota bacterium]|nr:transposase [Pseudomonadota bacterium]
MAKQLEFFRTKKNPRLHGGEIGLRKRKNRRPIDVKKPLHVVLRSDRAKGKLSLLNHQFFINKCLGRFAGKFNISIYEKAIVGNHIHLLIRGKERKNIQDFFRTIASLIARHITKARRGHQFGKFWSYLLFSRLLNSWKREFSQVKNYIVKNTLEALGRIRYIPRKPKSYALF